ncbi:MAG: nucleotidyltransferase domain-containing protein [Campylobacterales bacterium]|nr:nucleotidyltransferase domain-containing protein [Campylobacterales bacterium]MBD3796118.1 nucleotidyltransferase domain-containing protein [Campylobacterota bacterium]MBD3843983.1 nucleotidyltransferase domain-containing protein [Campylobacterales bacterium]
MEKDELFYKIKNLKPILEDKFGINKLAIFGSYSTNRYNEESDIDIVILEMRQKNLLTISKAQLFLEEALKKKVDIGLFDSLRPFIRNSIQKDLIYV